MHLSPHTHTTTHTHTPTHTQKKKKRERERESVCVCVCGKMLLAQHLSRGKAQLERKDDNLTDISEPTV
jgi:hypothetical protein